MATLTNRQKASILLIFLGPEIACEILKHLEEHQIEELSMEIAKLGPVKPEVVNEAINEFHEFLLNVTSSRGGMSFLKEILLNTLGPTRAMAIINRLSEVQPFRYLKDVSGDRLANILAKENPQTVAIILSYISPAQAAGVFAKLPEETKMNVAMRIASAKYVQDDAIKEINRALEKVVVSQSYQAVPNPFAGQSSGTKVLAEILNRVDHTTESSVLSGLQNINTTVADDVKKQMFLFSDLIILDDRSVQRLIREVDSKVLTLALKISDDSVKMKIFKNMSERARDLLKEEMSYLGPVRIKQVEEAQQNILEVIRRLEQAGEVTIPKRGEEEKMV
jgi:flagellar motor switch protein FliG